MSYSRVLAIDPVANLGVAYDNDTGDAVILAGDTVVLRVTRAGVVTPGSALAGTVTATVTGPVEGDISAATLTGQARGDLIRRGAATWDVHPAKTSGQLVGGDGTDVKSMPVTGDIAIAHAAGNLEATIQADAVEDSMISSEIVKNLGNQAVGHLDSTGTGADTETVTIGTRVYELDTHTASTITGDVRVNVSGGSTVKAQGTLTLTQNAADTNTVTIGTKVYTFQTVLTNADGNVLIGATASDSIDNLIAAINLGAGGGTTYAAATTLHPSVSAAAGAGDTLVATAKAGGTAGNSIATTDTLAGASAWDAATLGTTTAGVNPTATEVATALATAINADATRSVDAIDVGDGTVLLVVKAAGATMPALAESSANIVRSGATMVGGAAAAVKSTHTLRRTLTAADVTVSTDQNGTIAIGALPATAAPSVWLVQVRSSAGVLKACANVQWSWVQANTNFYVLKAVETQIGATDFANSDTIDVIVIE